MATIRAGILGYYKGKLGSATGQFSKNGAEIVSTSDRKSPNQSVVLLESKKSFGNASTLFSSLSGNIIYLFWDKVSRKISKWDSFMSSNKQYVNSDFVIQFPQIIMISKFQFKVEILNAFRNYTFSRLVLQIPLSVLSLINTGGYYGSLVYYSKSRNNFVFIKQATFHPTPIITYKVELPLPSEPFHIYFIVNNIAINSVSDSVYRNVP